MAYWNYRIVRYRDGSGYGLHEVHYDAYGSVVLMGARPAAFVLYEDEDVGGIVASLERALRDAREGSVIEEFEQAQAPLG